ncbi:hypothetical protein MAR_036767, partial [Mya arenaria]
RQNITWVSKAGGLQQNVIKPALLRHQVLYGLHTIVPARMRNKNIRYYNYPEKNKHLTEMFTSDIPKSPLFQSIFHKQTHRPVEHIWHSPGHIFAGLKGEKKLVTFDVTSLDYIQGSDSRGCLDVEEPVVTILTKPSTGFIVVLKCGDIEYWTYSHDERWRFGKRLQLVQVSRATVVAICYSLSQHALYWQEQEVAGDGGNVVYNLYKRQLIEGDDVDVKLGPVSCLLTGGRKCSLYPLGHGIEELAVKCHTYLPQTQTLVLLTHHGQLVTLPGPGGEEGSSVKSVELDGCDVTGVQGIIKQFGYVGLVFTACIKFYHPETGNAVCQVDTDSETQRYTVDESGQLTVDKMRDQWLKGLDLPTSKPFLTEYWRLEQLLQDCLTKPQDMRSLPGLCVEDEVLRLVEPKCGLSPATRHAQLLLLGEHFPDRVLDTLLSNLEVIEDAIPEVRPESGRPESRAISLHIDTVLQKHTKLDHAKENQNVTPKVFVHKQTFIADSSVEKDNKDDGENMNSVNTDVLDAVEGGPGVTVDMVRPYIEQTLKNSVE